MKNPHLNPQELAELEAKHREHRANQPYASEIEDLELEQARKERRPVDLERPSADGSKAN